MSISKNSDWEEEKDISAKTYSLGIEGRRIFFNLKIETE